MSFNRFAVKLKKILETLKYSNMKTSKNGSINLISQSVNHNLTLLSWLQIEFIYKMLHTFKARMSAGINKHTLKYTGNFVFK
jgi:hypothetical protein